MKNNLAIWSHWYMQSWTYECWYDHIPTWVNILTHTGGTLSGDLWCMNCWRCSYFICHELTENIHLFSTCITSSFLSYVQKFHVEVIHLQELLDLNISGNTHPLTLPHIHPTSHTPTHTSHTPAHTSNTPLSNNL